MQERKQKEGFSASCVAKHVLSTHYSPKEVGLVVFIWGDEVKDYIM